MNPVGQASCDLHNIGHYLAKLIGKETLYWDKLNTIEPDYNILTDHVDEYFINKDFEKDSENRYTNIEMQSFGRKFLVRGKPIILVFNKYIPDSAISKNPFSVMINQETDSINTLLIHFNRLKLMVRDKDYAALYSFFNALFTHIYGKDSPFMILHALYTYIDFVFNNLHMEDVTGYIKFHTSNATEVIMNECMRLKISDAQGFLQEILNQLEDEEYKNLFYSPKSTGRIIEASSKPKFNLKGLLNTIDKVFKEQNVNTLEVRDVFISLAKSKDLSDITKVVKAYSTEVELYDEIPESIQKEVMDIIVKRIRYLIESEGIKDIKPETEDEKKTRLEGEIEAQVRKALDQMNNK